MEQNTTSLKKLTSYEPASLREVAKLSLAFILVLFSASLMGFCDRLILARYSIEGLESGISALWLSQLFQIPIVRAVSMTQAFVGQYKGAGQLDKIGPCVWQMIWFSLITMLIMLPLMEPVGTFFFKKTTLQEGQICFRYFMSAGFLFPLGTALSSFYLGQGQTKRVLMTSLIAHAVHILLDFPLVFGIPDYLEPMGARGSVIATISAQLLFCLCLLQNFLKANNRITYATRQFSLKWSSFWKYISISVPRSVTKMIQLGSWIAITRIMISKGGDYAAILAFGGSLQLFLLCLNEGMSQALTTIGAYIIGSKQSLIWKAIRSGCLFLILESSILAIPLIFFPESMVSLFFKQSPSSALSASLSLSCIWIWLSFLAEGLNLIGFGLLSAYGDTLFQMYFSISSWISVFVPIYFLMEKGNSSPENFWLVIAIAKLIAAAIYFLRLLQEKWKNPILN